MKKVRFIHGSDVHLGSILHCSGELAAHIADKIQQATFKAFENLCAAAIRYKVDFIVLSGDVFDQEARSVEAVHFFNSQCRNLQEKNIRLYIIAGNHDPLHNQELFDPAENVFWFDSEKVEMVEVVSEQKELLARIIGQSYRGRADSRPMHNFFPVPDKGAFNIGLLHTQLEPQNKNYVPCSLAQLREKKEINYWALGHIHKRQLLHNSDPVIAFAGIPQGRDISEQGPGGCLLVEAGPDGVTQVFFIPAGTIIWKKIEINLAASEAKQPENLPEIENLLLEKGAEILHYDPLTEPNFPLAEGDWSALPEGYVVQWVLTGRSKIHKQLMEQEEEIVQLLTDNLRKKMGGWTPFLWTDAVIIRTEKELPAMELLKQQSSIFEDLEKIAAACLDDSRMQKQLINELGKIWEQKVDHEIIREDRFQLDHDTLRAIVGQAQQLAIEKILERRGEG